MSLKVKQDPFLGVATNLAAVSPWAVHCVMEHVAQGDTVSANNDNERSVLRLMKEVEVITSEVPGSAHARAHM
jgi:hypothetical protein